MMEYESVLQECSVRTHMYRLSGALWNLTHEENCFAAITDLLARCTRLEEALERANEACAKWEARAEQTERALARMWYAYANKDTECPHEYEQEAVREAERILGKWEDAMPGAVKEWKKNEAD